MRAQAGDTYFMMGTQWPAVLKRSIRGLQFFAHAPGFPGVRPEPESEQHRIAKVTIVRALRAAGYDAWVERPGTTSEGESWQADVLCQANARMIAFEVQLAQQTLEEYEIRSARYANSGVKCVWLVRAPKHYQTLQKAIYCRLQEQDSFLAPRPALAHLAVLPLDVGLSKTALVEEMRVTVFPGDSHLQIPLTDFAIGVAGGRLTFSAREWRWRDSVTRRNPLT
jgi:hypothetical protein